MAALVVVGLAAWGLAVKASGDDLPHQQRAAPTRPLATTASQVVPIGPPPWVRYPTPLEGRWVSEAGPGRITLLVSNASFDVLREVGQRQGFPPVHRLMILSGDRIVLRVPGDRQAVGYRWRIDDDQLTFEPLANTVETGVKLQGLTFVSAR